MRKVQERLLYDKEISQALTMTNTRLLPLLFLLAIIQPVLSQNKATLFTLGDQKYPVDEFEYYFLKNTDKPDKSTAKQQVEEYLQLYIDFRLKVLEARSLNMHLDEAYINELDGYKDQLLEPYLTTSKLNDELVQEAYDRLKWEVSGSHILIQAPPNATPEDTIKIWNQLEGYKKQIMEGADFGELAQQFSHDRSAKQNKGHLGYFSAMQMVYPFENAAYNNEIGAIVGPFKTRFGYHILQIEDKRPARGQVSAAHIMIRHQNDSASKAKSEEKARSIYENLMNGMDWDEQCRLYSEDNNTSKNGGQLRWFGTGQLVPEFEDVAFGLDSVGQLSEPVLTRFGWHIIKLLDKKGLEPLPEKRTEIENKISRDSRSAIKKSTALAQIKERKAFKLDTTVKNKAFAEVDSSLLQASWVIDSTNTSLANKVLFTLGSEKTTVNQFWTYLVENQKTRKSTSLEEYLAFLYGRFEEQKVFDFEKRQIEMNNQDYKMIMDEYKSGILLFNLMEDRVWNKAIEDTAGLQGYYDRNKANYPAPEKLITRKLVVSDSSLLDSLINSLDCSNAKLDSIFNKKEPLTLQASNEEVAKGENTFLDSNWRIGNHVEAGENYYTLWVVTKIKPAGYKDLKEVKGLVISDYQTELEKQWLTELRTKYPVKINKSTLKKYVKSLQ